MSLINKIQKEFDVSYLWCILVFKSCVLCCANSLWVEARMPPDDRVDTWDASDWTKNEGILLRAKLARMEVTFKELREDAESMKTDQWKIVKHTFKVLVFNISMTDEDKIRRDEALEPEHIKDIMLVVTTRLDQFLDVLDLKNEHNVKHGVHNNSRIEFVTLCCILEHPHFIGCDIYISDHNILTTLKHRRLDQIPTRYIHMLVDPTRIITETICWVTSRFTQTCLNFFVKLFRL